MGFELTSIVDNFVAEIVDFPFATMTPADLARLRDAWNFYPVLRFRNAGIDDARQVKFSLGLGPAVIHPRQLQQGANQEFPEILVVSNLKKADGSPAGDLGDGEVRWHTDTWFVERPPSAAILRSIKLPPSGGNTYFANMYGAYESLDAATKRLLQGLRIHHQTVIDGRGEVRLGMSMPENDDFASWPGVDHPIVRRHADSQRIGLYLGGDRKHQSIVGMPQDEAEDLLARLWRAATDDRQVWIQEWQTGDMMMWDNRCLLHRRDAFDAGQIRLMHRTTAQGEVPIAA